MILCRIDNDWFVSTGINHEKGICWLRCGPQMPHPPGFKSLPPAGALVYGAVPYNDGITFYPELRFMGMVMHPVAWDRESSEPILKCRTGKWVERPSDEEAERVIEKTKELGWEWQVNEGGWGRIHVDDLEKIEGPPPDGAF